VRNYGRRSIGKRGRAHTNQHYVNEFNEDLYLSLQVRELLPAESKVAFVPQKPVHYDTRRLVCHFCGQTSKRKGTLVDCDETGGFHCAARKACALRATSHQGEQAPCSNSGD
jgi:hypothetical protein